MMSGDKLSAEEAERIGMIYQCIDDESGLNEAIKLTEKIGAMPTKSIGYIKQLFEILKRQFIGTTT